jgi:hypothetical protein
MWQGAVDQMKYDCRAFERPRVSARSPPVQSTSASAFGNKRLCPNARTRYPDDIKRRHRLVPMKPPPPKTIADFWLMRASPPTPRGASSAAFQGPAGEESGLAQPRPVQALVTRLRSSARQFSIPKARRKSCIFITLSGAYGLCRGLALEAPRLADVTVSTAWVAVNRGGTSILHSIRAIGRQLEASRVAVFDKRAMGRRLEIAAAPSRTGAGSNRARPA